MKKNTVRRAAMQRAWELRRMHGYTLETAMRIAWAEMKGVHLYAMHLGQEARHSISLYLAELLANHLEGAHDYSKYQTLRAALALPEDAEGVTVMNGKMCGLCKYAVKMMAA